MTIYAGYGKMWPPEAITELNDANLAARLQAQRGDRLEAEIERLRADIAEMKGNSGHLLHQFDQARAEIASLRDQLGEALVRENNLIAALEEIIRKFDYEVAHELLEVARKALANEEDFAIAKTRMNEPDGLTHEELKKKYRRAEGEG